MEHKRPFDSLQKAIGKQILIELLNGKKYIGKLVSFDMHLNIVLRDVELETGKKLPFIFLRSVYGIIAH